MARYEFVEGNSSKFWEATLDGVNLIIRFWSHRQRGPDADQTIHHG